MDDTLVLSAVAAAKAAGKTILTFYRKNISSNAKSDGSPLTCADQASHKVISALLDKTGIPVVSEEGADLRLNAQRYWLVDPLDGTKDFLAANDEFTVNIALVERGIPVLGVLYAPALDELYAAVPGEFVWQEHCGVRTRCRISPKSGGMRMAVSRFHDHPDSETFAEMNRVAERIPLGAALKYGRLAMGRVDVYPRLVGTSEWDTAAGQAVLSAAGGCILDLHTRKPLLYGKPGRRNGRFLAIRAPYLPEDIKVAVYEGECL